ncbi:transglycosylase SLT domain-containing protein [Acinetobacter calcoaceticus]|uniref:transglycosylase SLT domain-containing protein n=1 Tax=Acinetobacter calcoaceticus TaxID=471 RepID=UPI0018DD563C|nr:transglycosylase SLT domain-containing protein [Acinetobacter calcoaceticus]
MANSYKDPYWSTLSANTEKLLKLPTGLLQNIVMHGEKSNADQVSSAGAKTVYQITPTTRNLVLKKYGVDAYLNDKNAAMAAGLLLQESLKRNKGNVEAAVGEYHGGTDRKNWGSQNQAYRKRVVTAQNGGQPVPQQQNTYQRVKAQMQDQQAPTIAKVYDAYRTGKLNAQQKKDFESDVQEGKIMLPEGAQLTGRVKPPPVVLPQSLSDAYVSGRLDAQQRADLEADMKDGKVKLPVASRNQSNLPDFDQGGTIVQEPTEQAIVAPPAPDPTLGQRALGVGETALSAATGATGGTLGMLGGTIGQAGREILSGNFGTPEAAQRISQNAAEGAADLTYAPRTQTGQEYTQALGEISEPLVALTPALSELALAGQAARGVAPIAQGQAIRTAQAVAPVVERAGQAVQRPIQATANAVRSGVDNVREMAGFERSNSGPAPANMGAAQVPQSVIREQQAVDLPIPIERMTEGQLLRDPMTLKEESELSKLPAGDAYRKLQEEQTAIANMNMEKFNEMTGSKETDLYQIGKNVDDTLRKDFQIDRMKTREAYKAADKSEEAQTPVDLTNPVSGVTDEPTTLTGYLNGQVEGATETIIPTARKLAVHHKIATNDAEGNLVPLNPTIQQLERFRSDINAKVNNKENADIRQAAIIKNLVDAHTEPFEGKLYKTARSFRRSQARKWENNQIIKDLIGKKNGTDDRKIAYENVVNKIINTSSLDDMRQVKRTLLSGGSQEGKQAWQEIQGAVVRDIQQKATAGIAPDAQGQQMISPAALNKAIQALEKGGKLDFIFGKQGADKMRALNDVSKDLFTIPKSTAANHSNTNSALALTLDMMAANFTTGLPLPLLTALKSVTRFIKDNKTRARVNKSIITLQKPQSKGGF